VLYWVCDWDFWATCNETEDTIILRQAGQQQGACLVLGPLLFAPILPALHPVPLAPLATEDL